MGGIWNGSRKDAKKTILHPMRVYLSRPFWDVSFFVWLIFYAINYWLICMTHFEIRFFRPLEWISLWAKLWSLEKVRYWSFWQGVWIRTSCMRVWWVSFFVILLYQVSSSWGSFGNKCFLHPLLHLTSILIPATNDTFISSFLSFAGE